MWLDPEDNVHHEVAVKVMSRQVRPYLGPYLGPYLDPYMYLGLFQVPI